MNDVLRREILSLIEAPELREYLAELADDLNCDRYAEIIAGAPTNLWEKQSLLSKLLMVAPRKDKGRISEFLRCLEIAINALEQAERQGMVLLVELQGHDEQEHCTDCIDGPYITKSLPEAQSAIRTYRAANNEDDWSTLFWKIELYDLSENTDPDGFRQPAYTFVCSSEGVPQFSSQKQNRERRGRGMSAHSARTTLTYPSLIDWATSCASMPPSGEKRLLRHLVPLPEHRRQHRARSIEARPLS